MTLNSVFVECSGAFDSGQISVALGRVRSPDDITVSNFRRGLCPPHPPAVSQFYGRPSEYPSQDLTCCHGTFSPVTSSCQPATISTPPLLDLDSVLDDSDSESEDESHEEELHIDQHPIVTKLEPNFVRTHLRIPRPITKTHMEINECIDNLPIRSLSLFIQHQEKKISQIHSQTKGAQKTNSTVNLFLNQYGKSEEFYEHLKDLSNSQELRQSHLYLGIQILLAVQNKFFETMPDHQPNVHSSFIAQDTGDAKLRYVGGMCVGKVIYRDTQFICCNVLKMDEYVNKKKKTVMALRKHLYNSITIAQNETTYPDSLSEIIHRQTQYGHLTIIDDPLFIFFKELQQFITPLLTPQNLHQHKQDLFCEIMKNALESIDKTITPPAGLNIDDLSPVITKYIRTCLKEMGLRLQESCQVKKKMAHRKQVLLEEVVGSPAKKSKVNASDSSHSHADNTADTSSDTVDPSNICAICKKEWKMNQRLLWIECTECLAWLHRKCDRSLKQQSAWKRASAEHAHYSCPSCRKNKVKTTCILLLWHEAYLPHNNEWFERHEYWHQWSTCMIGRIQGRTHIICLLTLAVDGSVQIHR